MVSCGDSSSLIDTEVVAAVVASPALVTAISLAAIVSANFVVIVV